MCKPMRLQEFVAGALQIVSKEGDSGLERLRAEYVVRIQGQLRKRSDPNPNLPTGQVELVAEQVHKFALPLPQQQYCMQFSLLHGEGAPLLQTLI